jgi:hypothetical protein
MSKLTKKDIKAEKRFKMIERIFSILEWIFVIGCGLFMYIIWRYNP